MDPCCDRGTLSPPEMLKSAVSKALNDLETTVPTLRKNLPVLIWEAKIDNEFEVFDFGLHLSHQ